ncbi:MAG TPA: hypothetical protein IAB38_05865 [Candidatus Onthousia excrementipullorum]|uniref:DNA methylase N-4/N-6 domain-containing protein n=1 Tax=Candidatus Onthousia excrementipullorum TaxID=2840884 RepID=A0A9D1J3Q0_9FIRM|nr:hypothetical protein [Candidatus Onthousia excrementipullorum]
MRETTRPVIYRTMKYWGKKPHNIWGNYIKKYCPKNGIVLDPFVGSGMTYFESIKNNRNPITIDINPISDISIRCLTKRNIDIELLSLSAKEIIDKISKEKYYINEYVCSCDLCGKNVDIYNYKINGKSTITYKCNNCNKIITKEIKNYRESNYVIDKWIPTKKMSDIESVSESFLKKIDKDCIAHLWTNRNLKILSEIYDMILKIDNSDIKELLVFAFLQCLHLTSKMCIPRNDNSNRPLSTSWGRPAYMLSKKTFEQNPLLAFEKAVFNGTGILKALKNSEEYLGKKIKSNGRHFLGSADEILDNFGESFVDLVITDPPYGNLIQYGDLSEIWVSWLEHYNSLYKINHNKEIIINKNKNVNYYKNKLKETFIKLNKVLKNDGFFILTFNSNKKEDWESLFYAIKHSNFKINKILLQKNKRSSEANVKAKNGIAISDYYLICQKGNWTTEFINNFLDSWEIDV